MAHSVQKKIKFSKGQVSPKLVERTDIEVHDSSAQKMENFVSSIYGGVYSRRGTEYVDTVYTNSVKIEALQYTSGQAYFINKGLVFTSGDIGLGRVLFTADYGDTISSMLKINKIKIASIGKVFSSESDASVKFYAGREFYIQMVGGGGGGSNNHGGRGAGIKAYVNLTAGTYTFTCGAGGAGAASYVRNHNGYAGGASVLSGNGMTITCGGGEGRYGRRNGGGYGRCGVLSYTIPFRNTIKERTTDYEDIGTSFLTGAYGGYGAGGQPQPVDDWGGYGGVGGYLEMGVGNIRVMIQTSKDNITWNTIGTINVTTNAQDFTFQASDFRYVRAYIGEDITLNIQTQVSIGNFVAYVKSGKTMALKKFIYNDTDKYLFAFGDGTLNIYKDDTLSAFLEVPAITESILKEIKLAYKDDTVIITHPNIVPKEIKRTTSGGWTVNDFSLKNIPTFAFNGETTSTITTSITPSGTEGAVKITASGEIFNSSYVGNYIDGNGGRLKITEYVSSTVVNGYTVIPFYTTDSIASWSYISGYEPVWSASRGYPRTCLFAQQRLWFGGSKSLPDHVWASRLGDYNNFKNSGNYDNDSIDVTLLTNDPILNMIENRGIQIFTSGDEYASNEEYTPDEIAFTPNTHNGSLANITPVLISGTTCYVEKNGKSILSYVYDYNQASYVSNNLSLYTDLIQQPVAMDVEINSSTDKGDFIYTVLDDGSCLVACVVLDQNIMSMSKITTDGSIKDVCCVRDDTYFVVERDGISYIEKLQDVRTDFTKKIYISSNELSGLNIYDGHYVYVYNDDYAREYRVLSGAIDLDQTLEGNYYIGIPFSYELESMPIAINGKTATCKKRISKATVMTEDTDKIEFNKQIKRHQKVYDFYACTPYGEDVRFTIEGEFYPISILSVTLNLNYEG